MMAINRWISVQILNFSPKGQLDLVHLVALLMVMQILLLILHKQESRWSKPSSTEVKYLITCKLNSLANTFKPSSMKKLKKVTSINKDNLINSKERLLTTPWMKMVIQTRNASRASFSKIHWTQNQILAKRKNPNFSKLWTYKHLMSNSQILLKLCVNIPIQKWSVKTELLIAVNYSVPHCIKPI